MERGLESPFLHLQQLVRDLVDPLRNRITMLRSPHEGFQNEHLQSPLEQ